MIPNFFQGARLKKIWVGFTGYILQGTFYRVPFKSILRVQIKWAKVSYSKLALIIQLFLMKHTSSNWKNDFEQILIASVLYKTSGVQVQLSVDDPNNIFFQYVVTLYKHR